MMGGMIFFMAVLMIPLMFVAHVLWTNHRGRHGTSSHATTGVVSLVSWVIKTLLRVGIRVTILGPMMLLTVRGRKTGKPRTIPIDVYERDDRRFLIATHGEGNWVHNLRAAGEGILSLGWKRQAFTAVELTPEAAGAVIRDTLSPLLASHGLRGSVLRRHLGVTPDSSLDDFITVARSHPVFELGIPGKPSSVGITTARA
jgi:deazaflavin-dependent oxidoreductase (nitroreductase family)